MEMNTVERATKTEMDTRTEFKKKEWASSVGLCRDINRNIPYQVKVSPRGRITRQHQVCWYWCCLVVLLATPSTNWVPLLQTVGGPPRAMGKCYVGVGLLVVLGTFPD